MFVIKSPDISGIQEKCTIHLPEQTETVFQIGLKLHIASLVWNYEGRVLCGKPRSHTSGLPTPEAVGTTRIKMLLERQGLGIAVCKTGSG